MVERPSVLIVSNGHGEDTVGKALAAELASRSGISAYPLVGLGGAYQDVPLLDPRRALPSGGFGLRGSWRALLQDLRAAAVGHWLKQRRTLRLQTGRYNLVIAIGDVYCLWMAARADTPTVFVATAKSEYNEPHRWAEQLIIRRIAPRIFTRDQVTADSLGRVGIPAKCVGNPLMDTITFTGESLPLRAGRPTVTLLPGSRADAYKNLEPLLRLCDEAGRHRELNFLCVLAQEIDSERVVDVARQTGWTVTNGRLRSGNIEVELTRSFGDSVRAADVVVGLAGTANEQAAGLGKPVVAFPGRGSQFTTRFMTLQRQLLGDALVATSGWWEASEAVLRLLQDDKERIRRGNVGRQRMGPPGAVKKIAEELVGLLAGHGNVEDRPT